MKAQSLEALFLELESLVDRLEQGEHTLEESLRLFERGVWLCREGSERLDQAEQDISQLLRDGASGALRREPWNDPSSQGSVGSSRLVDPQKEDDDDEDDEDDEGEDMPEDGGF